MIKVTTKKHYTLLQCIHPVLLVNFVLPHTPIYIYIYIFRIVIYFWDITISCIYFQIDADEDSIKPRVQNLINPQFLTGNGCAEHYPIWKTPARIGGRLADLINGSMTRVSSTNHDAKEYREQKENNGKGIN